MELSIQPYQIKTDRIFHHNILRTSALFDIIRIQEQTAISEKTML